MFFTRQAGGGWDLAGVCPSAGGVMGATLRSRTAVNMVQGCTVEQETALRAQVKARILCNKEAVRFYEPVVTFDTDEDIRAADPALRAAALGLFMHVVQGDPAGVVSRVEDEAIFLQGGVHTSKDHALYSRLLRRYMDQNRHKSDYPYSKALRKYGCLKLVNEVTSHFLQATLRVTGAEFVRGPAYMASKDYGSTRVSEPDACGLVLHTTTEAVGPDEEAPLCLSRLLAAAASPDKASLSYASWSKARVRMLALEDNLIMKCPFTHACTMPTVLPSSDLLTLFGKQENVAGSCYHCCQPMLSYFSECMAAKKAMVLEGQKVIAVCGLQGRAYSPLPILRQWPDLNTLEHMNSPLSTVPGQMQHVCLAFALEDGKVLMFDPTHDQVNGMMDGDKSMPFFTRELHVSHGSQPVTADTDAKTSFYAYRHAELLGKTMAVRNMDVLSAIQTDVLQANPACLVKILRARRLCRAATTIQRRWRYARDNLHRKYKLRVQREASVQAGRVAVQSVVRHETLAQKPCTPKLQDVEDFEVGIYEQFGPVLMGIQLKKIPGSDMYQAQLNERFSASCSIVGVYNEDYRGAVVAVFRQLGWIQ